MNKLEKSIKDNTNIVVTNHKLKTKTEIKKGVIPDNSNKVRNKPNTIGMSKGGTFNMDNYESCRIDVWASVEVKDDETLESAFQKLDDLLTEQLEHSLIKLKDE